MPTFQLIASDTKTGKSQKVEVKDPQARALVGLKIGDTLDASLVGLKGKLKITGGSDGAGFPMRPGVHGGVKRYLLLSSGPGFRESRPGERRRKMVRGNTITDEIYQVNAILIPEEAPPKPAKAKPRARKPKAKTS